MQWRTSRTIIPACMQFRETMEQQELSKSRDEKFPIKKKKNLTANGGYTHGQSLAC
jgi:hypothetical protein